MALLYYPMQDNYETTLARAWDGNTGSVYVNATPTFTFPASSYTFITVDPGTDKEQVFVCNSYNSTTKTLNAYSVTVNKGPSLAYTSQTHNIGAKVIISDCYANREAMKNAIDQADALNAIASNSVRGGVRLPTLAEAQVGTDAYLTDPYVTQPSQVLAMINERTANAGLLTNLIISTSRATGAETIALKTDAGTDPTATDPIRIAFRNATAGTGDYTVITISSATSITIPSTALMGASNGAAFRMWLVAFNNSGTVVLGVVNTQVTDGIYSLSEDELMSATAIGTGSDSAGIVYGSSAITTKAFRILGYLDYTLATAGTRDTAPSKIQLFTPGMKKPGDVVQTQFNYTGAVATGTTVVPNDDTIPQNTEGDEYFTKAIAPRGVLNKLQFDIIANGSNSVAGETMVVALFQDSTASALANVVMYNNANYITPIALQFDMVAGTVSSTTFKVRIGGNSGTFTLNGVGGARKYGGTLKSGIRITEFMV